MNQPESFRDFPQKNEPTLSFSRIKRGSFFFVLLSAVGFTYITWQNPGPRFLREHTFSHVYLILIIPLLAADYILGGGRFRIFFNGRLFPRISLWHCIRSNWANMFTASLTPAQTGGMIGKTYVLWKHGADIPQVSLAAILNFMSTLSVFTIFSAATYLLFPFKIYKGILAQIIQPSLAILSIAIFFILTALVFPALSIKFIVFILKILPISHTRRNHFVYRCIRAILRVHRDFMTITRSQNIYYGFHGCSMLYCTPISTLSDT